ncbi:MAG: tetratricopeptide (TPR) repeat protein [Myxococcota bacterium]
MFLKMNPLNQAWPAARVAGLAIVVLLLSTTAASAGDWEKYKGDCDSVLDKAQTAPMPRVKECVGLWTAYIDPTKLKAVDIEAASHRFQALYNRGIDTGDEEAQYLAQNAAQRASVTLKPHTRVGGSKPPVGVKTPPSDTTSQPKRKKFVPPDVSARDKKKANELVDKGVKYFRKKKRDKALDAYERALEHDPGSVRGLFNRAAELAHRKQKKEAVAELQKLQDIGSDPSLKALQQARVDSDFDGLHDYVPFKRVTGFARIKVVNSLGEYGEDEVARIVKTSKQLKYVDVEEGVDKKKNRETPVIWFKKHSAPTAWMMKKIVIHPGTVMTHIHWDTPYDVIVSWGNKLVKRDGVKQPSKDYTDVSPAKAEKRLDNLSREEDKVLRKPEKVARDVNHAVETPERVTNKVEGGVKRVERTIETLEKTGSKVDKLFK